VRFAQDDRGVRTALSHHLAEFHHFENFSPNFTIFLVNGRSRSNETLAIAIFRHDRALTLWKLRISSCRLFVMTSFLSLKGRCHAIWSSFTIFEKYCAVSPGSAKGRMDRVDCSPPQIAPTKPCRSSSSTSADSAKVKAS